MPNTRAGAPGMLPGGTYNVNINGTVGATTPATGAFTTLSATGTITCTNGNDSIAFSSAAATTGYQYARILNSAGGVAWGVENSGGTGFGFPANYGWVAGVVGLVLSGNNGSTAHLTITSGGGISAPGTIVITSATSNAIGNTASASTNLNLAAGTTSASSVRLPHGSAPTSPVDGDMWTTTAGLFVRINGVTVGPLS